MLDKNNNPNDIETIQTWLDTVDTSSADVLSIERDIFHALTRSQRKNAWTGGTIAPLAEPVNLDELVGDLFRDGSAEMFKQAKQLDLLYKNLSDLNNLLKTEMETVEKNLMEATDTIQSISLVVGDENRNFYWVSDSFNNNIYVDKTVSTCLVDTDYGSVTLGVKDLATLNNYILNIDTTATNGIPGCNLLVLSKSVGSTSTPILEQSNTKDLSNLNDQDPSSWFEVERNFIAQKQKLKLAGRDYIYSEAGSEMDVKEVTLDLDWKVTVEWPDGKIENGPDGKGKSLAEWVNLDSLSLSNVFTGGDYAVKLVLEAEFDPQPISFIKLLPLLRYDEQITVDSIQVLVEDVWLPIVKDIQLGTNKSTTKIQREILRRTGAQTTGSIFNVPTNRNITKVRISLSSLPIKVPYGFGHPYRDVETAFRTERNHGLWRTVSKHTKWGRVAISAEVPKITSSNNRNGLLGTILNLSSTLYSAGNIFNSVQQNMYANALANAPGSALTAPNAGGIGGIANTAMNVGNIISTAKIGGTLGKIGGALNAAAPYLAGVMLLDQLVGGLFNVKKTAKVLSEISGYDIFNGYRAAIGIRDITFSRSAYFDQAIIQSTKRMFPGPVSKIGLFVDETIPESWGPGGWIAYQISVDGTNWLDAPQITDTTLDKSISLDTPTSVVYFRAIIRGNPNDPFSSPSLNHYSIQGLPSL